MRISMRISRRMSWRSRRLVNLVPRTGPRGNLGRHRRFGTCLAARGEQGVLSGGDVRIFGRQTIGSRMMLRSMTKRTRFRVPT